MNEEELIRSIASQVEDAKRTSKVIQNNISKDEMRMAKFETLIEDINNSIKGVNILTGISPFFNKSSEPAPLLDMVFDAADLNGFALTICNKATFLLCGEAREWDYKYNAGSLRDAKTKIEAAKDFVKYCRADPVNRPEAYKFIFWSLMILSVENQCSDEWLSLICDFVSMLRITEDELIDMIYVIKCVYNKVEEEYTFKTETIPKIFGSLFNLYGKSDSVVDLSE